MGTTSAIVPHHQTHKETQVKVPPVGGGSAYAQWSDDSNRAHCSKRVVDSGRAARIIVSFEFDLLRLIAVLLPPEPSVSSDAS